VGAIDEASANRGAKVSVGLGSSGRWSVVLLAALKEEEVVV